MNFLTTPEAAKKLGVSRQMVHYLIKNGHIQALWMLGRWAIPTEEVARYKRHYRNGRVKAVAA